ncbi:MAG: ABC transporter substrate-binding protein, partial [Archaeoglobaceae archaeon]|nr:ABC transporter substrate-binding protein [Archaeoglobaceae archaeon]MDW8128795.1 ABC transporter substrate-binding protein [Archaeoglobaceae archaeon]
LSLLILLFLPSTALIIIDSAENVIEIQKAERIVCLNSDCLEAVLMLGAKDRVVGLGTYALQKPYAPNVTDVGKWSDPNVEAIISLNPDVVITYVRYPEKEKLEKKLEGTNIKVVRLDFYKINKIFEEFITLGKILGKEREAKEFADYWKGQLDFIEKRLKDANEVRIYWESFTAYKAAGNGSGWQEIIELAKGYNVFIEEPSSYPQVDAERIIAKNPEVVIKSVSSSVFQPYGAENKTKLEEFYREFISRAEMSQIEAGKGGRVYLICADMLHSTFGLIAEVAYVAKILHPELFEDLNPEELHRKYIESLGLEYKGIWLYPEIQWNERRSEKEMHKTPGFELILAISAFILIGFRSKLSGGAKR